MRFLAIAAVVFASSIPITHAQDTTPPPTPESTLSVSVRVVSVDAIVRDKQGQLVLNLDKDAFSLREDGKPVPIRYFNRDNDLPLTIGLMVDTSGSQREFFSDEALASDIFLRNTITHPQDRAFVVRFDSGVYLLQKMTSSLPALHNALRLLDYADPRSGGSHGGTLLFDAISTVSHSVIGKEPGRRALVVLTDGDDNGSKTDLSNSIRQAQLSGTAVYSVLYTNENPSYPHLSTARPSGIDVMQQISRATGGREFIVGTGTPIAKIFAAIAEDLRSQYRLGFTPANSKPNKYHTIDLKTVDKTLTVQARSGYYTPE